MDYSIKDLPESERPRERLKENGANALSDSELVALLLGGGTREMNAKDLASKVLSEHPVRTFSSRTLEDFTDFTGISLARASRMVAAGEFARRMKRNKKEKLSSLQDIREETSDMQIMEKEKLRVFYLSSGNEVLGRTEFKGEVTSIGLPKQNILSKALKKNASAIVIAHNHPSGQSEATEADKKATRDLMEASKSIGIELLDHVIVGESFHSMRASSEGGF